MIRRVFGVNVAVKDLEAAVKTYRQLCGRPIELVGYFKDRLRVNRIGMITSADKIGELNVNMVRAIGKLVGVELVEAVSQPASDRDLLPSLRRLASIKPPLEGLMVFGSGPFGTIAINQTELAGLNVPVGYIGGNVIPELIKDVGPETGKRTYIFKAYLKESFARLGVEDQAVQAQLREFKLIAR